MSKQDPVRLILELAYLSYLNVIEIYRENYGNGEPTNQNERGVSPVGKVTAGM